MNEVIRAAGNELKPLWSNVRNCISFHHEVLEVLNSVYEKHRHGKTRLEEVLLSRVSVGSLLEDECKLWMKMIHRRLTTRMTARNPWQVQFQRDMSGELFNHIKDIVKNGSTDYGVSYTENTRVDSLLYTKENRLVRDLEAITGLSRKAIIEHFSRTFLKSSSNSN